MTIESMPASPVVVRDDVPLMSVEPESNVAWLPELEPVVEIAETGEVVEAEMKLDEAVGNSDTGIRNTPAA